MGPASRRRLLPYGRRGCRPARLLASGPVGESETGLVTAAPRDPHGMSGAEAWLARETHGCGNTPLARAPSRAARVHGGRVQSAPGSDASGGRCRASRAWRPFERGPRSRSSTIEIRADARRAIAPRRHSQRVVHAFVDQEQCDGDVREQETDGQVDPSEGANGGASARHAAMREDAEGRVPVTARTTRPSLTARRSVYV